MNSNQIDALIKRYREAGWIATRYPRLKRISLNGHRRVTEEEAIHRMNRALASIM